MNQSSKLLGVWCAFTPVQPRLLLDLPECGQVFKPDPRLSHCTGSTVEPLGPLSKSPVESFAIVREYLQHPRRNVLPRAPLCGLSRCGWIDRALGHCVAVLRFGHVRLQRLGELGQKLGEAGSVSRPRRALDLRLQQMPTVNEGGDLPNEVLARPEMLVDLQVRSRDNVPVRAVGGTRGQGLSHGLTHLRGTDRPPVRAGANSVYQKVLSWSAAMILFGDPLARPGAHDRRRERVRRRGTCMGLLRFPHAW